MAQLIVLHKTPKDQHTSLERDSEWDIVKKAEPGRKVRELSLRHCPRRGGFVELLFFETVKKVSTSLSIIS